MLAKLADRVLAGFPGAFGTATAVIWTGNPVRQDIAALPAPEERYAGRAGGLQLLVVGGSQGAQVLNTVVPEALALLPAPSRPAVTHQAGAAHQADGRASATQRTAWRRKWSRSSTTWRARYAEADLIICRAGASTIAELAAAGVASVLVPYPHAVDDHQTQNARFLAGRGAALLMPQARVHRAAPVGDPRRVHARAAAGDGALGARGGQARGDAGGGGGVHGTGGMTLKGT